MDIGYLSDGTIAAQEPQDESTDPTRLLRSFGRYCFGFMSARDVIVPPGVTPAVVGTHIALPVGARSHSRSVSLSSGPPGSALGRMDS